MLIDNPFALIDSRFNRLEKLIEGLSESMSRDKGSGRPPCTRREAADYLGISLPTLDNLEKSGRLKGFFIGRQKRYRWESVEAIAENEKGGNR